MRVLILGAGPAGLSAALAFSKLSATSFPIHITIFELRPVIQTIGGSVHITPDCLQHLDQLGVYPRLQSRGTGVRGIDLISMQTGMIDGAVKEVEPTDGGFVGMRILRHTLVEEMTKTAQEHSDTITIRFGMKVILISEGKSSVILEFENGETVEGDLLLGCDGLHSASRQLYVEPDRQKIYSGRAAVIGFFDASEPNVTGVQLANGDDALRESCIFKLDSGSLLMSYYEPTRTKVFAGSVMAHTEPSGDLRDGWRAIGDDLEQVRTHFYRQRWVEDKVKGLADAMNSVKEWQLWPIYWLNRGGAWIRGHVVLLGEAAHAMPVQGESISIAIEDGLLLAQTFEQRCIQSVDQILFQYEQLRRPIINSYYDAAMKYWNAIHTGSLP